MCITSALCNHMAILVHSPINTMCQGLCTTLDTQWTEDMVFALIKHTERPPSPSQRVHIE